MVNKAIKSQIVDLSRDKQNNLQRGKYKEVAEICNYLGELLVQEERYDDAISEHETELEMCEMINDDLGKAIAYRKMGECYCTLGDYDKAVGFQQQHLLIARTLGNDIEQQRAHATLGRTYLCKAEAADDARDALQKAQQAFNSSLSLATLLKDETDSDEYSTMVGRLYLNLGIVSEMSGNTARAIRYLHDARTEMTGKKLNQEEQKCLITLSGVYQKTGNYASAKEFAAMAYIIAKQSKDKLALADCLLLRAGVFLESENFVEARHCLKKLIKSKSLGEEHKPRAKKMIRSAAKLKELLLKLKNSQDRATRLKMMESIADEYCGIECYYAGLRYYKKLLELLKDLKTADAQLIPVYVSLAQTCADLRFYKEAIKYSMEETKVRSDPDQLCKTWLNIAEYTYYSENNDDLTVELYNNAIQEAEKSKKPALLLQCLRNQQSVYRVMGDAEKIAELNERIQRISADAVEEEDSDTECEISYRTVSDEEELSSVTESDGDEPNDEKDGSSHSLRKRIQYKIRRNDKGETLLHVAVINGSLKRVRHLVSQGHPVNERDHCGWLPIHEAANHNHLDIATFLIEHNALINDKGLSGCNGLTPILDAAYCGNLKMVRLLMDRGANVACKDDEGNTLIDALLSWRKDNVECRQTVLDADSEREFETLLADVQAAMIQAGVRPEHLRAAGRATNRSGKKSGALSSASSSASVSGTTYPPRSVSPHLDSDPTELYREAIGNVGSAVRRKRKRTPSPKFDKTSNDEALVRRDEFIGDDWLIEDVIPDNGPKLSRTAAGFVNSIGIRDGSAATSRTSAASSSPADSEPSPARRSKKGLQTFSVSHASNQSGPKHTPVMDVEEISQLDDVIDIDLADVPDTESTDDDEILPVNVIIHPVAQSASHRSERNRPVTNSPHSAAAVQLVTPRLDVPPASAIRRVRVRILEVVILVPVIPGPGKTVGWLCDEAATRYSETKGLRPVLQLKTHDGALLSSNDQLTDVMGDQEEILGIPLSWNIPPATDRYTKACQAGRVPCFKNVLQALHAACETGNFALENLDLIPDHVNPLFRTLQFQSNLRHISLQGCLFRDVGFTVLMEALLSMPNVTYLNLACADLTIASLECLKRLLCPLAPGGQKPLQNLTHLILSHNDFTNAGMRIVIEIITELPCLEELSLADCGLVGNFLVGLDQMLQTALEKRPLLRCLSFAQNSLDYRGMIALLSQCSSGVRSLNISSNLHNSTFIPEVSVDAQYPVFLSLQEFHISDCGLDLDKFSLLLPLLRRFVAIKKINISENHLIGSGGMEILFNMMIRAEVSWSTLNLRGIPDVVEKWMVLETMLQTCSWLRELVITIEDTNLQNQLSSLWRSLRGSQASVHVDYMTGSVYCLS